MMKLCHVSYYLGVFEQVCKISNSIDLKIPLLNKFAIIKNFNKIWSLATYCKWCKGWWWHILSSNVLDYHNSYSNESILRYKTLEDVLISYSFINFLIFFLFSKFRGLQQVLLIPSPLNNELLQTKRLRLTYN